MSTVKAHLQGHRDQSPGRFLDRFMPVLGVAGAGLLAYLIVQLGPARIVAQLRGLGSVLPIVLLLTAAKYPLQAAGWRLALPRAARPPWGQSISATISGDALGYLTWAGPFTGEPLRALLIRGSVPVAAGIAAGAIERAMYNATAALLVLIVLMVLVPATAWLAALSVWRWLALAALVGSAVLGAILAHRHVRARSANVLDLDGALESKSRPVHGAAAFLQAAKELWRDRRGVLPSIAVLCFAQHAILVGEAYLLLSTQDRGTTLRTALVFEAVTKIVNTAGTIVPGRLGVAEGGSAALAEALGFAASHGLSLALMRRVRALIWGGVGLVLLPFQEARARKSR